MVPIGGTVGQLLFYGSIVLVASLSGGALFRSWCVTRRGIVLKSSQQWSSEITGNRAHVSAMVLNTCRAVVFLRTYAVSFRQ